MIVVIAIDGLEHKKVEEFSCEILKQTFYGKTDISEFSEPRTMVLWSSFMTGENKESEVLSEGNKEMWNKVWKIEETFFSGFKDPCVIDLPGFSYDLEFHENSRILLKKFFETKNQNEKEKVRKQYNSEAFEHHRQIKKDFFKTLEKDHDFVMGYFSLADVIGHLNFGNNTMMKMIYKDMEEIAERVKDKADKVIVISDHGMEAIGMFGDHSNYGFWSTNFRNLKNPKITDFREIIMGEKNED